MNKKESRLRRSRKTRIVITKLKAIRLVIHKSNCHIYAQIIDASAQKILTTASTLSKENQSLIKNGGNVESAKLIGKQIAEKSVALGIQKIAFDRSGFKYHGRIKALADAARENGLVF